MAFSSTGRADLKDRAARLEQAGSGQRGSASRAADSPAATPKPMYPTPSGRNNNAPLPSACGSTTNDAANPPWISPRIPPLVTDTLFCAPPLDELALRDAGAAVVIDPRRTSICAQATASTGENAATASSHVAKSGSNRTLNAQRPNLPALMIA